MLRIKEKVKGGGSKKSEINNDESLKQKQIDSLKQKFLTNNILVINPGSVFDIPFIATNSVSYTLRVTLGPQFPHKPPTLQILKPPCQHNLLDEQGFLLPIANESLHNWTAHANLGVLVHSIVHLFVKDPPQTLSGSSGSNNTLGNTFIPQMHAPIMNSVAKRSNTVALGPRNTPNDSSFIPKNFDEINLLSATQMESLLYNENDFMLWYSNLQAIKSARIEQPQPASMNVRMELATLQKSVNDQKAELNNKEKRKLEIATKLNMGNTAAIVDKLRKSSNESEVESEELMKQFLSGAVQQQDFIKEYMTKRRLYHGRSAKKEYWTAQERLRRSK